jgi:diguanylate cyclase (GGDEF)-like protein
MWIEFLSQIALLITPPILLSFVKTSQIRITGFYVYLALVLFLGGFFGYLYSFELFEHIYVSGAIILYGAFMMTSVTFVFIERDFYIFRNIVRLVIAVAVFKFFLLNSIVAALPDSPQEISVSPAIFELTIPLVFYGAGMIIVELLTLLYIFDKLKQFIHQHLTLALIYSMAFFTILILDGVIFPFITLGITNESLAIVVGNLTSKMILATVYTIPLLLFMLMSKQRLEKFINDPFFSWQLLFSGDQSLLQHLNDNEEKLQQASAVFRHTREGILVTDLSFNVISINQALRKQMANLLPKDESTLSLPKLMGFSANALIKIKQHLEDLGYWQQEISWIGPNNNQYHGLFSLVVVEASHGKTINYAGTLTDISELNAIREELRYQANHDPLTELPNRRLLQTLLANLTLNKPTSPHLMTLLLLDLDNFKSINDSYGLVSGDAVLIEISQRLSRLVTAPNSVYRLGGDEFSILIENANEAAEIYTFAEKIREVIGVPITLDNNVQISIDCCIGISMKPQNSPSYDDMFQQADTALYWAKGIFSGTICSYESYMTDKRRARLELEAKLREAIAKGHICSYFQPKITFSNNKICGAEALVRWIDENGKVISPITFIPLAEEIGLIEPLTKVVLEQTCEMINQCIALGFPQLKFAVNISPTQIQVGDIEELVLSTLSTYGVSPAHIELEITETALVKREDSITPKLERLRSKGISIALDDFGTGYSNLSHLQQLPIDVLKIDRSFIQKLPSDKSSCNLTNTVITLALNKGCKIVAEGVEREDQRAYLAANACDYYQGYLYSPPLPAKQFITLLTTNA